MSIGFGIEFKQVTKHYGHGLPLVVKGIDFAVPKGTLTTILGPSGCGKTTTLRMIAGLESPTSGRILIDGRDVTELGAAQRNVSLVFQSYALFPHMSVIDNVGYGLRVGGVSRESAAQRARQALEGVGLVGLDARLPSELSGGQQQRVALARALVLEPSVLLFDEPLSNLDARLRRTMRDEIRALQQRAKLTVAYVTHDQGEALAVSDQILVMDGGTIAQAGTPRELYERPASSFVAGFMGEALLFDAVARPLVPGEQRATVVLGPLRVDVASPVEAGAVKVAVRPEAWVVDDPRATSTLPGTVAKQAYLGTHQELTVDCALGAIFVVARDAQRPWAVGDRVMLSLLPQGVCVLTR
jgi:iron(III) transport system ATP-binding protein